MSSGRYGYDKLAANYLAFVQPRIHTAMAGCA